jgi:hypothetical protein
MAKKATIPYWLGGGTEVCAGCDHPVVHEQEYRCAACDHVSCEHCVVVNRETGEVLCTGCHAQEHGNQEG